MKRRREKAVAWLLFTDMPATKEAHSLLNFHTRSDKLRFGWYSKETVPKETVTFLEENCLKKNSYKKECHRIQRICVSVTKV